MNKNKSRKNEEVLEDLQYDLDALLIQSISEINTSFFDTKFLQIHDYLDVYFGQEESLVKMTNEYRKNLLNAYENEQ